MQVIDCFLFFNELDVLKVRLNYLKNYVDSFVLVESPVTFSGKPKSLVFNDNKEQFSDFNITHIIADPFIGNTPWDTEEFQRNQLMRGLDEVGEDEVVLISDCDEIPNMKNYPGEECVFCHDSYFYYFNHRLLDIRNKKWLGTIAMFKKNLRTIHESRERRKKKRLRTYVDGSWHFSSIGSLEQIMSKFDASSHREIENEAVRNQIISNIQNLCDPWYRVWGTHARLRSTRIEIPSGPDWLLENKETFSHLFYNGGKDSDL